MDHHQLLVCVLLLGLFALSYADPAFSRRQRRDADEKSVKEESAVKETLPAINSPEVPTDLGEKAGVISVIQSTAESLGLGGLWGNKKKKPLTTTPSPYKGDANAKPIRSLDESHQVLKEYLTEQDTDVNIDASSLTINPASDVDGKTGLAGLVGGAASTVLQTGATLSEAAGNFVDHKVSGLGGLVGSASPVNQASSVTSHAARSLDVDEKTSLGLAGLSGGAAATVLQTGATLSETAGNFVDHKISGLGGLLGSASHINQASSHAGRSLDVDGKTGPGLAGLFGGAAATVLQTGATLSETAGNFVDQKVSSLGSLLGSASPVNQASAQAARSFFDVDGSTGLPW